MKLMAGQASGNVLKTLAQCRNMGSFTGWKNSGEEASNTSRDAVWKSMDERQQADMIRTMSTGHTSTWAYNCKGCGKERDKLGQGEQEEQQSVRQAGDLFRTDGRYKLKPVLL